MMRNGCRERYDFVGFPGSLLLSYRDRHGARRRSSNPCGWSNPSSIQISDRVRKTVVSRLRPSAATLARTPGFCGVTKATLWSKVRIVVAAPGVRAIDDRIGCRSLPMEMAKIWDASGDHASAIGVIVDSRRRRFPSGLTSFTPSFET